VTWTPLASPPPLERPSCTVCLSFRVAPPQRYSCFFSVSFDSVQPSSLESRLNGQTLVTKISPLGPLFFVLISRQSSFFAVVFSPLFPSTRGQVFFPLPFCCVFAYSSFLPRCAFPPGSSSSCPKTPRVSLRSCAGDGLHPESTRGDVPPPQLLNAGLITTGKPSQYPSSLLPSFFAESLAVSDSERLCARFALSKLPPSDSSFQAPCFGDGFLIEPHDLAPLL